MLSHSSNPISQNTTRLESPLCSLIILDQIQQPINSHQNDHCRPRKKKLKQAILIDLEFLGV